MASASRPTRTAGIRVFMAVFLRSMCSGNQAQVRTAYRDLEGNQSASVVERVWLHSRSSLRGILDERDVVGEQPVAGDLLERFVSKTVPILLDAETANRVLEIPECATAMERREQLVTCFFVVHGVGELLHDGPLVDLVLPWQFEVVLGLEGLLDLGHHLLLPARKKVPVLRVLGSPFFLCRDSYYLASHSIEIGGDLVPRHTHLIDDFAQLDRNRHDMHSTGPL